MICKQTPDLFLQMAMGAQWVTGLISWACCTMENTVLFLVAKISFRIGGHHGSKRWGLLFSNVTLLRWENQRERSIDLVLLKQH